MAVLIAGTLSLFTTLLVNRMIVCVVVPDCTSTTCTGIVGRFVVGVALAVGEAAGVGVPLPTVAVGVPLPVTVAVATGPCCIEVVGMTVGVPVDLERSIVLGVLLNTVRISYAVFCLKKKIKFLFYNTLT